MTNIINGIKFSNSSNSIKSYVVTAFDGYELIDFQVEMINSNEEAGFLSIEKRQYNSEIQLYYDTTSLIPIDKYFKENKIDKNKFLNIIKELCNIIIRAEEQYLSSCNYILDIEKIYISEETFKLKLIYLPIEGKYNEDINEKIKLLIKEIIVDYANVDDTNSDNFIQKILNYLKKDTITVKEVYEFLNTSINNTSRVMPSHNINPNVIPMRENHINVKNIEPSYNSEQAIPKPVTNSIQKDTSSIEPKNEKKGLMSKSKKVDKSKPVEKKDKKEVDSDFEVKEVYKTINIIISAVLQVVVICVAIAAFLLLDGFEITEKCGVVLIAGAVDFIVLRSLLDKKKKVKMKIKAKNNSEGKDKKKKKSEGKNLDSQLNTNVEAPLNTINPSSVNFSKREISTEGTFETELLTTNYPYLLSDRGGSMEKIYISKDRFTLGRLSTEVDYTILNKAIGKSHAEIVNQQGSFFIIDLNSRNGTFINGQRLESNTPYPLNENDQVMMANSVYVFKLY